VIAIIGVLIALLLPAIQAARESARRSSCSNNMKQLGIALHTYHDTNNLFPSALCGKEHQTGNSNWGAISMFVPLLPFIEQGARYQDYTTVYLTASLDYWPWRANTPSLQGRIPT